MSPSWGLAPCSSALCPGLVSSLLERSAPPIAPSVSTCFRFNRGLLLPVPWLCLSALLNGDIWVSQTRAALLLSFDPPPAGYAFPSSSVRDRDGSHLGGWPGQPDDVLPACFSSLGRLLDTPVVEPASVSVTAVPRGATSQRLRCCSPHEMTYSCLRRGSPPFFS